MAVSIRTRVNVDHAKVRKQVKQANFKSLEHAGAAIRLTARRSIRRRKVPSRPGTPPHTPTGMLKRVIRHGVTPDKTQVVIGPINEIAGRLWNLHEFGGVATRRRQLKAMRFRVGDFGPVVAEQSGFKTRFVRAKLQTEAQANRATRLLTEEIERRASTRPRKYPKRPFMGPAFEKMKSRLPRFWANSVKSN